MKLRDIVRINEKGLVADAVNLKMMDDPAKNLQLCEGFIFNYDAQKPKESTVGVLVKVQESFHGQNHPNVHLVVQDYGKGKSHFALVMANFFKHPADSAEVQGILHQIEMAVGMHSSVGEDLMNYKKRNKPHLVIRLSGDQMTDLKAAFLKSLRAELEAAGVTESIGQYLCAAPLAFLRHLNEAEREQAETYLNDTQPNLNLEALITAIEDDNYSLIHLVKEISRKVHTHGLPIEFESDLDLETVLAAVVKELCAGAKARFAGVLILLDELLPYLQGWASDPNRYGGSALQNLTNACENNKGKIALITFSQVRPQVRNSGGVPLQSLNDYQKLTSRLEKLESTYEPRASLEIVLDNLIHQEEGKVEWKDFEHRWHKTLKDNSEQVFNHFVLKYKEQGWDIADFNKHLAFGSFPLHPLTACLLANLEFTQNRTVIGFIKEDVKAHIEAEEAEFNGKPNYIYAHRLVEAFKSSLSGHSIYHDYQKARIQIQAAAEAHHLRVLESLFLYYASGQKLTKKTEDEHSKVLSAISGLSEMTVREVLRDLCDKFHVLYYVGDSKLYRFYQGLSPAEVSRMVDEEIGDKQATLAELARYGEQLPSFALNSIITPESFVDEFQLVGEDWRYKRIFVPAQELKKALLEPQGRLTTERGVVVHILYEKPQDREAVYKQAQEMMAKHPENHRVLIAIPAEPVGDLLRVLKQYDALNQFTSVERQRLGAAFDQQLESWTNILAKGLGKALEAVDYYCIDIDKRLMGERQNPSDLISEMLRQTYRFVAPLARNDKLGTGHRSGTKIASFIARQMLSSEQILFTALTDQSFRTVIDHVFVDSWKLFVKTSDRYKLNPPTHHTVKKAWEEISYLTALGEADAKEIRVEALWQRLAAPPFGYNELTFTVLFSAWLAAHRQEVAFKGDFSIPQGAREIPRSTQTATRISEWANANVFDKPKDFLSKWATKPQNKLIRHKPVTLPTMPEHCSYDEAKELLAQVNAFLNAGNGRPEQIAEAQKNREELTKAVARLEKWAEEIRKLEQLARQADLNLLLSKVYSERKRHVIPEATSGNPVVSPSEEHRGLSKQILDNLDSLVQARINELAEKVERVNSEQEFGAYKNEIERINPLLVGSLESFKEILQTALQGAKQRVEERKQESEIKAKIDEVTEIESLIDATTSQNWCVMKLDRLNILAQTHSQIAQEEIFQRVRRKVENCLESLAQQLDKWGQKLQTITSLQEANILRNEINRQSNRFTEPADRERVESLLEQVERACNEFQEQESVRAKQEAEFNVFRMSAERIRSASLSQIPALYKELQQKRDLLTKSYNSDVAFVDRLTVEWERAHEAVHAKLSETIKKELQEISRYEQLKAQFENAASLSRMADFAEFAPQTAEAIERLEARHDELRLELEDRETLQQINTHSARHLNTISALDEAKKEILRLSGGLHRPENVTSETQKTLLEIEEKRERYSKQLEELEGKVNQAKTAAELKAVETEMLRIEATFKESSLSERFDTLQGCLRDLRSKADSVAAISKEAEKSNTIAECLQVKAMCEEVTAQIQDSRFEAQLANIIVQLNAKILHIVEQLAAFERQLREGSFEQIKKLRRDLDRCHNQYANSQHQEACERLTVEAEEVEKLLELGRRHPRDLMDTHHLIEDAERIMASSGGIAQKRGAEVLVTLGEHKTRLHAEAVQKAKITLEGFYRRWREIEEAVDTITKIRQGEEFLRDVHQHQTTLNQFLPHEHQTDITELIKAVQATLDSDRETQICTLFNSLPEEMKSQVYARLGELLAERHISLNGQPELQPITGSYV